MNAPIKNVLFLCLDNCSRSIFAESVLRKDGGRRFRAFSAGSRPGRQVHPYAVSVLESLKYPTDGLFPKDWFDFEDLGAPKMDIVITVCDSAAPENCPTWPGQPVAARWPSVDPGLVGGSEIDKIQAFVRIFYEIQARINKFMALPLDSLDRITLEDRLMRIVNAATVTPPYRGHIS
jgi:arsenate reductase